MAYTIQSLANIPFHKPATPKLSKDDLLTMCFIVKAFKFMCLGLVLVQQVKALTPRLSEDLNSIPGTHIVD